MNRCVDMFYVPYFSLHHQYKLSEFLGFCKTSKNVGYIFSASSGSLLHKHSKALTPPGPMQARELPQRTSLSFFFGALLLFPLFYAEKGDVWTQAL